MDARPGNPPGSADDRRRSAASGNRLDGLLDAAIALAALAFATFIVVSPDPRPEALPDLTDHTVDARKTAFFDFLRPKLREINGRVAEERDFALTAAESLAAGKDLSIHEMHRLETLARRYEIDVLESDTDEAIRLFRRRIDVIPESLALVQAAKESGWGTSRFARVGNNLFGQRCYEEDCGISPRQVDDTEWGVARFDSVRESLESYALNLNTHPGYRSFRDRRLALRRAGEPMSGSALAGSLENYSERGGAYVEEVRAMIRQNELE